MPYGRITNYTKDLHPGYLALIMPSVDVGVDAWEILAYTPLRHPIGQMVVYHNVNTNGDEIHEYSAIVMESVLNPEPPVNPLHWNSTIPGVNIVTRIINPTIELADLDSQQSECDICFIPNYKLIMCKLHEGDYIFLCDNCVSKMSKIFTKEQEHIKPVEISHRELDLT